MGLFKKVACATDIHYGKSSNSKTHNQDCSDFINWFIEQAKKENVDTCILLGDLHHHRNAINLLTLKFIVDDLKKLNDNFEQVFIIVGNHDLMYREKRDAHSLIFGNEFKNITIVDSILTKDDVAIVPWLIEDEWKTIQKLKERYVFGHFEIPGFKMNAMVEMPDHGEINKTHFKNAEYVFSGHFHKRQSQGHIHYIGNPFGHNYADAWDFERGMMILEWDGEPKYINYDNGPKYITTKMTEFIKNPEIFLKPKAHLSVILDMELSYEESTYLKEQFTQGYGLREFKIVQEKTSEHTEDTGGNITFQSVDQIVETQLLNIESDTFDKKKLIDIYNNL